MSAKNRKLQVFVSSTFEDLQEERQVAVAAILNAEHIPAGMELFAAGDQSQMQVIRDWIQESDVYMLILGGRYGSIEPESGKSYTQLEYEYAVEIGKPHFAVVISDKGLDLKVKKQGKKVLELTHSEKYNEFKKLVTTSKLVKFWDDTSGIELAIFKSLAEFNKREELVGWVRGDQVVDSGALAEELARLGKENAELREQNQKLLSNSSEEYGGISFENLYLILKDKKFLTVNAINSLRKLGLKGFEKLDYREDYINANLIFLLAYPLFNGVRSIPPSYSEGVFNFFQSFGLIRFVPSARSNTNIVSAELTENGRKYYFRLLGTDETLSKISVSVNSNTN